MLFSKCVKENVTNKNYVWDSQARMCVLNITKRLIKCNYLNYLFKKSDSLSFKLPMIHKSNCHKILLKFMLDLKH